MAKQVPQGSGDIGNLGRRFLPLTTAVLDRDDGLAANPLDEPAQNAVIARSFDLLELGRNDLKLQAGTAGVQDQNIHEGFLGE